MKKVIFFCLAVSSSFMLHAQPNIFPASGNVGIGTTSPLANLHVNGTTRLSGLLSLERATDNSDREISAFTRNKVLSINANSHTTNGATIEMYGHSVSSVDRRGAIRLISYGSVGEGTAFLNYDPVASTWRRTMTVTNDNKVHIGSDFSNLPGSYGLYVDRGILTEKVKVAIKNTADWSDFVFDKRYKLMPLQELHQYINTNKHLPDVPSASEMVSNGLDVAKMDASLLQKIEELTLYMIQLKQDNEALQKRIAALEKQ